MKRRKMPWHVWSLVTVLALSTAGLAAAQGESGNLYGTATDNSGQHLPGVTVTLSGPGADQVRITDESGDFRFLGLAPGAYKLEAHLDGYGGVVYEKAEIRAGRNVTLTLELTAAVEEVLVVTAESPLLDQRKITQGTSVTQLELQKLPTARDPWVVASQTPGVLMDRQNVGGNESGQQPNFSGPGSASTQNKFMIDGVDVTDQTAQGGSATYFGFEQFEEMSFSTGGTDITLQTPGVQINMVTKRGTNTWRGSGSYYRTDGDWQAGDNLKKGDLGPGQEASGAELTGNQISLIDQYGLELGGPLWKERLWIWGSYDKNNIDQQVFGGDVDSTELENYAVKLNAQLATSNSLVYTYNNGEKIKTGRDAGPDRPPETTFNQGGPSPLQKLEDTHVFSSDFFVTGSWSEMKGGFFLEPNGGRDVQAYQTADGIYHGSYYYLDTQRPSETLRVDASKFFDTGSTSHELKFGASTRSAENSSLWGAPGNGVFTYAGELFGGLPEPYDVVGYAWREKFTRSKIKQDALWVQDTLTRDRLTVNVGFRYDDQSAQNQVSSVPGSPFGDNLPGLTFEGGDVPFEWKNVSPRIGATYALGAERKSLLRASYSEFVSGLGSALVEEINPTGFAWAAYYGQDVNGNGVLDPGEPNEFAYPVNFSPGADPTYSPTVMDPDLEAPVTKEVTLGIEHALRPELLFGLTLTYRNTGDYIQEQRLFDGASGPCPIASQPTACVLTADDYVLEGTVDGHLPDGTAYSEPYWAVRPGLVNTGGRYETNSDRQSIYKGVTFSLTKRLKDRWMLRGYATYSDWTWDVGPGFYLYDDPTDELNSNSEDHEWSADNDGGVYTELSGGSGNVSTYVNSRWSLNLNGLYQLPRGFNVAANVSAREGFPLPFYANTSRSNGGSVSVQVGDVGDYRMDTLMTVDARIDKDFELKNFGLTVSLDVFNLFNEGTVLQRRYNLSSSNAGFVDQILGPRIARIGLRFSFK